MGDCFYCKEDCGWGRSVHKECKIEHYESGIKRLDSGIGQTAAVGAYDRSSRASFWPSSLFVAGDDSLRLAHDLIEATAVGRMTGFT